MENSGKFDSGAGPTLPRGEGGRAEAGRDPAPSGREMRGRIPWIQIALCLILLGAILFGVGIGLGPAGASLAIGDRGLRVLIPGEPIGTAPVQIPVDAEFSDVQIRAGAANIVVAAVGRDAPLSLQLANLEASVQHQGGRLVIDTRAFERQRGIQIFRPGPAPPGEITLHLPEGFLNSITAESASGNIRIEGAGAARLEARSASGSIRLSGLRAETALAASTSGSVSMEGICAAQLETRSSSGSIRLSDLRAETMRAASTSGSISGRNLGFAYGSMQSVSGGISMDDVRWNTLNAQTTSGQMRIAGADIREGSTNLRSVSGSVSLGVRNSLSDFTYSFSSTSGSFWINGERAGARAAAGGSGAHPIAIRSTSGAIRMDFDL